MTKNDFIIDGRLSFYFIPHSIKIYIDAKTNVRAQRRFQDPRSTEKYDSYLSIIGKEKLNNLCTQILLTNIDKFWSSYLAEIADIREGIHLTSIGGRTPFFEFQKLSVELFKQYSDKQEHELIHVFNTLPIKNRNFFPEDHGIKAPTATWTYLINDNSFENLLGLQLVGNIGLSSVAAFMFGPLLGLYPLLLKLGKRKKMKTE